METKDLALKCLNMADVLVVDVDVRDVLVQVGFASSRAAAKRLIDAGAVYIDEDRYTKDERTFLGTPLKTVELANRPYFTFLVNGAVIRVGYRMVRVKWTDETILASIEDVDTSESEGGSAHGTCEERQ